MNEATTTETAPSGPLDDFETAYLECAFWLSMCHSDESGAAEDIPDEIRAALEAARQTLREIRTLPGIKPTSPTLPYVIGAAWRQIARHRGEASDLRAELAECRAI